MQLPRHKSLTIFQLQKPPILVSLIQYYSLKFQENGLRHHGSYTTHDTAINDHMQTPHVLLVDSWKIRIRIILTHCISYVALTDFHCQFCYSLTKDFHSTS